MAAVRLIRKKWKRFLRRFFFYFFSTGFEINHFQETLQDSARNRRRPKRNSGQGEGEREGSGGKEEQKGGGKGVGADEKKTPLWLQRASLLQQKDDKVSFFREEQQQKMPQWLSWAQKSILSFTRIFRLVEKELQVRRNSLKVMKVDRLRIMLHLQCSFMMTFMIRRQKRKQQLPRPK